MIRISNGYVKKKYLLYNFNIFSILNEKMFVSQRKFDKKRVYFFLIRQSVLFTIYRKGGSTQNAASLQCSRTNRDASNRNISILGKQI